MVIGGAGLIGSHVVDELLNTDVSEILIYDNMFLVWHAVISSKLMYAYL